jgi:hypothetical protein
VGFIAWRDGAFKPAPAIAMSNVDEPREAYTPALRRMFPAGSDENQLRRFLHERGFLLKNRSASYDYWRTWPVCAYTLEVTWTADEHDQLTGIDSDWGDVCL